MKSTENNKNIFDKGLNEVILTFSCVLLSLRLGDTLNIAIWTIAFVVYVLAFIERMKE